MAGEISAILEIIKFLKSLGDNFDEIAISHAMVFAGNWLPMYD